ncbi:hypothetical protein PIB30_086252 [Stylosanthes scabra]|uniref:Uncharacterized protein n=1 Tax=Stylosanthes scabra TaxID=79078 RepID=A0ABU6YTS9_9FABA|nr:hypothetical protein [Stylosanthes scabra]
MKNVKLMTLKKPLMGGKPSYAILGNIAFYKAFSHFYAWRTREGTKDRSDGNALVTFSILDKWN